MEEIDSDNHQKNSDAENPVSKMKFIDYLRRPSLTDWLIVIITIILCVIANGQLQTAKKSDETSRLRDRAYLYFANPKIWPYPNKENPITYGNNIILSNTGSMPAQSVSVRHGWKAFPKSKNITGPWPLIEFTSAQNMATVGSKQTIVLQGRDIPVEKIQAAQKFEIDIFIATEVKYLDGFDTDQIRVTQMCRKLRFDNQGGSSFAFTDSHNCIDNGCN